MNIMKEISVWLVTVVLLFSPLTEGSPRSSTLQVIYEWKYLDWLPPSVQLVGNEFTLGNAFTQDIDVDKAGRVFVTSPKWPEGVPIVLSVVTDERGPGGPLLAPYPDWTWHRPNDCNCIVTAYRIEIDEFNRLWVTDIGRIGAERVCPTKILVFDLFTDQLIRKYEIPAEQTFNGAAALVTPIVDVGDSPIDTFLYMADVDANGIVVYDLKRDYSWRINNTRGNAFGPDDEAMVMTIAGDTFNLTDGILGMSLSPKGFFQNRYLYFNSLASYYQKFTDTLSLKTPEIEEPIIFQSKKRRQSQAGPQATSRRGILFFQLVQDTALACWNIEKPFTPENIVVLAQDEVTLQYVSGIKVIVNALGEEEVLFNTNRLQKTINNNRDPTEINYRIIKGKVDDLVRGTRCESAGVHQAGPDTSSWRQI